MKRDQWVEITRDGDKLASRIGFWLLSPVLSTIIVVEVGSSPEVGLPMWVLFVLGPLVGVAVAAVTDMLRHQNRIMLKQ